MFTILRKINGNRTPTEHDSPTLGDTKSQVFKDAMELLNESNEVHACMDSGMEARPWINAKPKPIEEWVALFKAQYSAGNGTEILNLILQLSPGMFDPEKAILANDFGQLEEAYAKDTKQTVVWRFPKELPVDIQFQDIPRQSPETLHTTLDFIDADTHVFAVYNSDGLWKNFNSAELSGGETTEVSSVELQHVYHDDTGMPQEHVLKTNRRGNRSIELVIGVLAYGHTPDVDAVTGQAPVTNLTYEFIYQGDEVYITNRHGKTVDSIR